MGHLCIKYLLVLILVKNPHHLDKAKTKGKNTLAVISRCLGWVKLGGIPAMALNLVSFVKDKLDYLPPPTPHENCLITFCNTWNLTSLPWSKRPYVTWVLTISLLNFDFSQRAVSSPHHPDTLDSKYIRLWGPCHLWQLLNSFIVYESMHRTCIKWWICLCSKKL